MGLTLKLLGEFALRDANGTALSLPTRKTRALLGYLAANVDRPQLRERLMALLWSTFGEKQARHNLNQALLSLRRLGLPVDSNGERVTLRSDGIDVDLARFNAALCDDPTKSATLYEGPFLDGLTIPDPAFEEWLAATRTELHDQACDALERVADTATENGDIDAAIETARRLIAMDSLREDAHRRLMQLLYDSGDRAAALRQYQACAEILNKELQVDPDAATRTLFDAMRGDDTSFTQKSHAHLEQSPSTEIFAPLPEIPSIAIMPFANLGGDPEQAYLAEGIRLDIQTMLVRIPGLFLVSTRPVDACAGRAFTAEQVARELEVRYVLEGAVQKSNDRVRITVQLTDGVAQRVVWAERYDRAHNDNFTVQDEITAEVLAALDNKLVSGRFSRYRSTLKTLEGREHFYRGLSHFYANTKADNDAALRHFERVAELEPDSPSGPSYLCISLWRDAFDFSAESRSDSLKKALDWADKSVKFGVTNGLAQLVLASDHLLHRRHEEALSTSYEAFDLRPNCPAANASLAKVLFYCGECEEAINTIKVAMRISRTYPPWFANVLAAAYRERGETENAVSLARQTAERNPDDIEAKVMLCSSLICVDQHEEAKRTARDILLLDPAFSVRRYADEQPFRDEAARSRLSDSLLAAGLPE